MAMMRWPNVFQARRIGLKRVRSRTAEETSLAIRCTACFEVEDEGWAGQLDVMHKSEQMSSSGSPQVKGCGPVWAV